MAAMVASGEYTIGIDFTIKSFKVNVKLLFFVTLCLVYLCLIFLEPGCLYRIKHLFSGLVY